MAQMKQLAQVLHDHGACDRPTCPFCDPNLVAPSSAPSVQSGLSSREPGSNLAPDGGGSLVAHTIDVLRSHGEHELADRFALFMGWNNE